MICNCQNLSKCTFTQKLIIWLSKIKTPDRRRALAGNRQLPSLQQDPNGLPLHEVCPRDIPPILWRKNKVAEMDNSGINSPNAFQRSLYSPDSIPDIIIIVITKPLSFQMEEGGIQRRQTTRRRRPDALGNRWVACGTIFPIRIYGPSQITPVFLFLFSHIYQSIINNRTIL